MEQHINLIRSIAWNFHRTTGIQWQELFSEACLAYCECLKSYNPKKSAPTTWAYHAMKNALINFCKREGRNNSLERIEWFEASFTPVYEFFEDEIKASQDTKIIINMVRKNPRRYAKCPRKAIGQIRKDLRERKKWTWPRIWCAMHNLREELVKDTIHRTVWL